MPPSCRWMLMAAALAALSPVADLHATRGDGQDANEAIRTLIVEAEAEGSRDLARSASIAAQAFERAREIGDRGLMIYARLTQADALLKARKLDEGDRLLTEVEAALGSGGDPGTEARLVVLRARWLRDLNRIDEAEAAFVRATALAERSGDEGQLAIVLNSHAAMLWRQAQTERSMRLLEQALEINQRLGRDGEAIKNLSYLSLIARDRGDFDLALRMNEQVLAISERRDDRRGIAVAANTIGLLLVRIGDAGEALPYFRKAADAYHQVGDPSGEGPALANVGTTLIELNDVDAAEAPLRAAMSMALSTQDPTAEVLAHSALAELALARDRMDEAEQEALAAIAAAARQPAPAPGSRAHSVLAAVRRHQGRLPQAITHGRLALEQARKQGRKNLVLDVMTELAADLSSQGQHAEAYALLHEASGLIQEIRDNEVRREVARTEAAYEARQREAEMAAQSQRIGLLEAQARQQRSIRLLLAIALATSALLMLALASRVLIKRRSERLLLQHSAEIERANRELAEAADTDMLTRARNRRYFHLQLAPRLQQQIRDSVPFALVLIDADRFKAINDAHGHDAGDRALIAIADAWRSVLGEDDTLLRWGGEEFLLVCQGNQAETERLVQRGLAATRAARMHALPTLRLSVSVGWVCAPWLDAELTSLLQIADRAMLQAKREGRDRAIEVQHRGPLRLQGSIIPAEISDLDGVLLCRLT